MSKTHFKNLSVGISSSSKPVGVLLECRLAHSAKSISVKIVKLKPLYEYTELYQYNHKSAFRNSSKLLNDFILPPPSKILCT